MGSRLDQRAREAQFWELLGHGVSRPAACDAVGSVSVCPTTGTPKGIAGSGSPQVRATPASQSAELARRATSATASALKANARLASHLSAFLAMVGSEWVQAHPSQARTVARRVPPAGS